MKIAIAVVGNRQSNRTSETSMNILQRTAALLGLRSRFTRTSQAGYQNPTPAGTPSRRLRGYTRRGADVKCRQARLDWIYNSIRQGDEVAADRRHARKTGTMIAHLTRFYPTHAHH